MICILSILVLSGRITVGSGYNRKEWHTNNI